MIPRLAVMNLLIPGGAELAAWAGVLAAALLLVGCGRLVTQGRARPEAALVAGWGLACLVLTLWGAATTASLRFPGAAIMMIGAAGLVAPGTRLAPGDWRALARIGAVSLPLLAVMASARPSLPDTFLNLLPNAAYLYDHAGFPADWRAPSYSFLPGAPYNLQLAAFLASLFTPGFPATAMILLNLVLQLGFALFLARLVGRGEDEAAPPSWGAVALGLLLATGLNPGFVPRYDFSAYSEASVTVTTAFAAWFAWRALDPGATSRDAGIALRLLALSLAALVNIKQDSVALALAVIVSAGALALFRGRATRARDLGALALAALPAALLYLVWRWYVLSHFELGELKPLPFAQWQFRLIPDIVRSMLWVVWEKPYFFGAVAVALALMARQGRRRGLDPSVSVAALFAGVFLLYNAALFLTYIAHFPGAEGADAHSYYRYNSHLGLLLMTALALLGRDLARERGWVPARPTRRGLAAVMVAGALLSPVVFFDFLRFDLELPQQRVWWLAALARAPLAADHRLALLLPGDNGSLDAMLEGLLRLTPPRDADADIAAVTSLRADTLERLAAAGYRVALVSCSPPGFAGLPAGHAALLERDGEGWHAAQIWSYPRARRRRRWSHVVAEAPLCL